MSDLFTNCSQCSDLIKYDSNDHRPFISHEVDGIYHMMRNPNFKTKKQIYNRYNPVDSFYNNKKYRNKKLYNFDE